PDSEIIAVRVIADFVPPLRPPFGEPSTYIERCRAEADRPLFLTALILGDHFRSRLLPLPALVLRVFVAELRDLLRVEADMPEHGTDCPDPRAGLVAGKVFQEAGQPYRAVEDAVILEIDENGQLTLHQLVDPIEYGTARRGLKNRRHYGLKRLNHVGRLRI